MQTFAPKIAHNLERYRLGNVDEAFHGLLEMDHAILPELMAAFRVETDPDTRAFLLRVMWQHRRSSVIPFLGEALLDPEPKVWQQALDGLVTLASPAALDALRAARTRHFSKQRDAEEFRRWLDEAVEQADAGTQKLRE